MCDEKDRLVVAVDYETYYCDKKGTKDYSLARMPTWQYCADPRFDAYLVAICGWEITDDGIFEPGMTLSGGCYEAGWEPGKTVTRRRVDGSMYRKLPDGRQLYVGRPEKFPGWENLRGRGIACHNASFDQVVTLELVKRGRLPKFLADNRYVCTADLSVYLGAPRNLKGVMKEMFGKEISKEVRSNMDGRHDYELSAEEYRDLVEYGGSDAVECHDVWLSFADKWPYMERRISELNRLSTIRGIRMDVEYAKASKKELESYRARVLCDIPWYPEKSAGSLPALKQAVLAMGLSCPKSFKKDDPGFLRWVDKHGNIPFIKARQKAISLQMCIARLNTMIDTVDGDGRSHVVFLYGGAHTLRFTGKSEAGGNINLLNLPRKPVMSGDENVFNGKGVDIRGMYMADPGTKLAVYDYSQIERRFVLWAVDDQKMLEGVKREGNLYEASAVEMGWCEPHSHIKKTNPGLYLKAKQCVTGDTPVLVRSEKRGGGLTKPYYKRIICVETSDRVWDGHEWVRHLGVEERRRVREEELVETCGICCTRDHKVYLGEQEVQVAGDVFGDAEAQAVAWGASQNPVQGWTHVRILAAALARACARAVRLAVREVLHISPREVRLHGVRSGNEPVVGQREVRQVHPVHEVRASGGEEQVRPTSVGEGTR